MERQAIEAYHEGLAVHPETPNARLHALMHVVVENQLASTATLDRQRPLSSRGHTRDRLGHRRRSARRRDGSQRSAAVARTFAARWMALRPVRCRVECGVEFVGGGRVLRSSRGVTVATASKQAWWLEWPIAR